MRAFLLAMMAFMLSTVASIMSQHGVGGIPFVFVVVGTLVLIVGVIFELWKTHQRKGAA